MRVLRILIRLLPIRPRIGISLVSILVALVVLYGLISFLIARGVTSVDRDPQEDHPSNYGLVFEDVEFDSRDGEVSLSGWYLPGDASAPHLIFVHGNGSVRSGDNAVDIASRLVGRGYNSLLFDLRGRGASEGDTASGGFFERQDVLGAFDYLVAERGASPDRIGLVGFSLGAATSIMSAALEPGGAAVGSSTVTRTGRPSGSVAASIMPFDSTPISFAASRLATMTTDFPVNSSGE